MRLLPHIILMLLFSGAASIKGNIPNKFQSYTSSEGLSNNYIRCINQDMFGYIWTGTRYGLNRFNGYEFTNYLKIPQDSSSLIGNSINDIFPSDSIVYIATNSGLCYYDYRMEKFIPASFKNVKIKNTNIHFHGFQQDKHKNIWVTSNIGVFRQVNGSKKFEQVPLGEHTNKNVFRVLIVSDDEFWYSIKDSLYLFNAKSKSRKEFIPNPQSPESISGYMINKIFEFRGKVYIATGGGGLNKFIASDESFEHYKFKDGILDVTIGPDSLFYFATWEGGLVIFDPVEKSFSHIEYQSFETNGINSNSLNCVFFDRSKSLWIGTYGNGINKHDPYYWNFNHITYDNSGVSSLSHKNVRSIAKDVEDNLWIGTEGGGLNKYNLKTKKVEYYKSEHHLNQKSSNEVVISLLQDNKNNIWVGTIAGLNKVDQENKKYRSIQLLTNNLADAFVKSQIWEMTLNPNGNIWLGTNNGLIDFNPETYEYEFIKPKSKFSQEILKKGVTSVLVDGNDLWLGTKLGLCKYRRENNDFYIFQHEENNPESLSNNSVNSLFRDQWGNIWVATDFGLNKFNISNQTFERFTEKDGLSDNRIISILDDNAGNLWISTNNGITFMNPQTKSFRIYNSRDGLLMNLYNSGAYFKDREGFLYFGGIKGVDYFHPNKIKKNLVEPDVYITNIQVKNNSKERIGASTYHNLFSKNHIKLKHNNNFFDISFVALNYTRSNNNKYKYILEGLENEWNDAQHRTTAFYRSVPPGDYVFKVIASNNDGIWNETGDQLKISIAPPLWKTWYAMIFYILLFMLLIYLGNKYTLIGVKLKNDLILNNLQKEKVKEVYDTKMKFFMNISHEFRTPLSLIIGPLEETLKRLPEKSEIASKLNIAFRNSNKMLNLVNQLLEFRTIETGKVKLRVQKFNILELINEVMNNFEEAACYKTIHFEQKTNLSSLDIWADKEKVERIITNLLSNAFKFTPEGGRITIYVTLSKPSFHKLVDSNDTQSLNERLKLIVEDTGKGIPEQKFESVFERFYQINDDDSNTKGTGIGLALCKELVELHEGSIDIESELGIGSRFIVRLPLGKDYLNNEKIKPNIEEIDKTKDKYAEEVITNLPVKSLLPGDLKKYREPIIKNPDLPKILLVDDNPDIIMFLIQSFEQKYNLQYALNVEEAKNTFKNYLPDIIISDVMMPGTSGLEFCQDIKSNAETTHIPVILLTAKNTDTDTLEGVKSGADHYITKPFKIDLLDEKIRNILKNIKTVKLNIIKDLPVDMHRLDYESPDAKFIKKLYTVVEENLSNPDMEVLFLVKELGVSRAQLYRKVETLCGQSVKEFVRTIRLKVAAKLLEKGELRVSEVMDNVGILNRPYFIKRFKEMFNTTPSEYMNKHKVFDNQNFTRD